MGTKGMKYVKIILSTENGLIKGVTSNTVIGEKVIAKTLAKLLS